MVARTLFPWGFGLEYIRLGGELLAGCFHEPEISEGGWNSLWPSGGWRSGESIFKILAFASEHVASRAIGERRAHSAPASF